jgi:hypothetical protein
MTGDELFRLLTDIILRRLKHNLAYTVSFARDSCAVNGVAVRQLIALSPNALNVLCFPHVLHGAGKHLLLPTLDSFMLSWITLQSHSHAAKSLWRSRLHGSSVASFSKVRWWSRREMMNELGINFGLLPQYLTDLAAQGIAEKTVGSLNNTLLSSSASLELELATVMNVENLCRATYRLEGAGLASLLVYRTIEDLRAFGRSLHHLAAANMPNVAALLRRDHVIAVGSAIYEWFGPPVNQWFTGSVTRLPSARAPDFDVLYSDNTSITQISELEVRNILDVTTFPEWQTSVSMRTPTFTYIESRITDGCEPAYRLGTVYKVMRAIQIFDPSFAVLYFNDPAIDELLVIHAVAVLIPQLKAEVSAYLNAATTTTITFNINSVEDFTKNVLRFWRENKSKLKVWARAARIVFAIPSTSASSERVFALLNNIFGDQQLSAMSDYLQAALMLSFNTCAIG